MKGKIGKIIKILLVLLIVVAALIAFLYGEVLKYTDTHTWATIYMTGTMDSDTADTFSEEHEYLKGEDIVIGTTILRITKITHAGDVTFEVKQGEIKNDSGVIVLVDTISLNESKWYRMSNGNFNLRVTNNRYQ